MKTNRVRRNPTAATKARQSKDSPQPQPKTSDGTLPTWKPDRAWLNNQRATYALLTRLQRMQAPRVIAVDAQQDQKLIFARDSSGKELFFLEQPKYQHPGERCLKAVPRRTALVLCCLFHIPSCLAHDLVFVLKKGGVW